MDCILTAGNSLYSSLGFRLQLLSVDELPDSICIENIVISIIKTNLETGLMTRSLGGQFLPNNNHFNANSSGNGIIFIMAGFSFAVIWSENGCYLFDSHSRDINGFPSPIGASVLLKFGSVYEVQEYIREVYFAQASNMSQYYQMQYLNAVPPPVEVRHIILETLGRKRQRETRIAKRTQLMPSARATIREQSHKRQQKRRYKLSEFEKSDITLKNTLYQKSKRKKYSTEKAVAKLKKEVKKDPFYICVVCNRALSKRTVQIFEKNKYQDETRSVFDYMVCSADGKQYICITCH